MPETRDMIIKVPKPDEDGYCLMECPLWYDDEIDCYCGMDYARATTDRMVQRPGIGCPWWEGEK